MTNPGDEPRGRAILCPKCRAMTAEDAGRCPACGARLGGVLKVSLLARHAGRLNFTKAVAAACFAVYFLGLTAGGVGESHGDFLRLFSPSVDGLLIFGLQSTSAILARGELWRIVTAMFVHLGVVHLMMNLLSLNFVGGVVEEDYGIPRYVQIFVFSGMAAGAASLAFGLDTGGASGAICGLIGAEVVYGYVRGGEYGRTIRLFMLKWMAVNVVFGCMLPGVNNVGHLAGFAGGALWGWMANPERGVLRKAGVPGAAAAALILAGSFAMMFASVPASKRIVDRRQSLIELSRAAAFNHPAGLAALAETVKNEAFADDLSGRADAISAIRTFTAEAESARDGVAHALREWAAAARAGGKGTAGAAALNLEHALDRYRSFEEREAAETGW